MVPPQLVPSGKLTVRPWQIGVGRNSFPLKIGDFQGQQVNLPGDQSYTRPGKPTNN